jgi:actin-related protein
MLEDVIDIQQKAVSSGTDLPKDTEESIQEKSKEISEAALTKEDVRKLVEEAVVQAKNELSQEKVRLSRELQSLKDKAIVESRRAREAEAERVAVIEAARKSDPELADKLELQRLRAREVVNKKSAEDETAGEQLEDFNKTFQLKIKGALKKLDVDPEDVNIVWGDKAEHPLDRLEKILESATVISQSRKKSEFAEVEAKIAKAIKDTEARVRKEFGQDSVDTATAPGSGTEAEFIKAYSEGKLNSAEDHIKARKILGL